MRKTVFFDSGIGGLSVLADVKVKGGAVYYAADDEMPLGEKSYDTVLRALKSAVNRVGRDNVAALVVACNTAFSVLEKQTFAFPFPVYGAVPPIDRANSAGGKTLVLATKRTIEERYLDILSDNALVFSPTDLAKTIEDNYFDKPKVEAEISKIASAYARYADNLVLGCTHYSLFLDAFKRIFVGSKVFDSANSLACRLNGGEFHNSGEENAPIFMCASDKKDKTEYIKSVYFDLLAQKRV